MKDLQVVECEGESFLYWRGLFWKKIPRWLSKRGLSKLSACKTLEEGDLRLQELEGKMAKETAIRSLSRKSMFTEELRGKLAALEFSDKIIEEILSFCSRLGLLDDKALLQAKIEKGLRSGRGINHTRFLCKTWTTEEPSESKTQEKEAILRLLQKKRVPKVLAWSDKRSVLSLLIRRGFARTSIDEALKSWEEEAQNHIDSY